MCSGWKESDNEFRIQWQDKLNCCGFSVFNDTTSGQPCPVKATSPCTEPLGNEYYNVIRVVSGVGIGFGVLQLLGLASAMSVIRATRLADEMERLGYQISTQCLFIFTSLCY